MTRSTIAVMPGAFALMLVAASCQVAGDAAAQHLPERQGLVTAKGTPVTLIGTPVSVGDIAPRFAAVATDGSVADFASLEGAVTVIASVPSLETPVCDREGRRFNEEAGRLGEDVRVVVVSMDLPGAQKRWCGGAGIAALKTYSDHREASFGKAYGVLMKGRRLLARAVFVVDRAGIVRHAQIVPETSTEPDYDAALAAVKEALAGGKAE